MKKAQSNLSDRETLLVKGNSNRQEAKELTQLIDNFKSSSLRVERELTQLEAKHVELEKELENVKAVIDRHKSTLSQIPMPSNKRNKNCWPKSEQVKPSEAASRASAKEDKQ